MNVMLNNKQIHVVGIGMVLVLAAGGYWLGVDPLLDARFRAGIESAKAASVERDAQVAETTLRGERMELEQQQRRLGESVIRLEAPSRLNDRMVRVTSLAAERGLVVGQIEPGTPSVAGQHTIVPFKLAGRATFSEMTRFLAALHGQFPDTRVDSLSLAAGAEEGKDGSFSVECAWFAAQEGSAGAR